jgi:acyl-CoA reductase-like NAD-dependent aldehyde dehydrogenase
MNMAFDTRPAVAQPMKFYIDGAWVEPMASGELALVCPATEEVFARFAEAGEADVDRAVAAARRAFDEGPWPRLSPAERADYLTTLYDGIQKRAAAFADAWTWQVGTTVATSRGATVAGAAGVHLAYYAKLIRDYPLVERFERAAGGHALVVRESVGVTATVIPWNAPLLLTTSKVGPALAMGGTVVVKPAPESPIEAYLLAEVADEIGLPPGVINVVPAERKVSEYLVAHEGVDKVAFTGSGVVGKRIAAICGERVARYTLELGGKSAAVILDDVEPGDIVETLVGGSTFLAGQACSGLTRMLVPRRRQDKFVDALSAAYQSLVVGDPFDEATQLGPLAIGRQRDRVEDYIKRGLEEGAKLATGGGRPSTQSRGFYVEPTVFYGANNQMKIAREEIFGPVATVIAYDTIDEAIAIANDSSYGLAGAVFTNDDEAAYRVARALRTGNVTHNGWAYDPEYPFGGFKQSGVGREGGVEGLHAYSEVKTIYMDRLPTNFSR